MPSASVDVGRLLWVYRGRWIVPAVAVSALALAAAAVMPETWETSQALVVRNEATGGDSLGRFHSAEEMKTLQETLLEIAKNPGVLFGVLERVGPPEGRDPAGWPSQEDLDAFASVVTLAPPKGAEFGKTEVFYLQVRDRDPRRAAQLATAVREEFEARYRKLRDRKAESTIAELGEAVELARQDALQSRTRLSALEQELGGDLVEIRSLEQGASGDSPLRRRGLEIENELRQAEIVHRANEELLALLEEAQRDPSKLVATPNRLLESQPALRRLKDGLVDAQLRTSQLRGTMAPRHPLVVAQYASEAQIRQHLHDEIGVALIGVGVELRLSQARIDSLQAQLREVRERQERVAARRAEYTALVGEDQHRRGLLEAAEKQLADARAARAGAANATLIHAIDSPDSGTRKAGPSRAVVAAGGVAGGVILGLSVLLLTASPLPPAQSEHSARWARSLPRSVVAASRRGPATSASGLSLKAVANRTAP